MSLFPKGASVNWSQMPPVFTVCILKWTKEMETIRAGARFWGKNGGWFMNVCIERSSLVTLGPPYLGVIQLSHVGWKQREEVTVWSKNRNSRCLGYFSKDCSFWNGCIDRSDLVRCEAIPLSHTGLSVICFCNNEWPGSIEKLSQRFRLKQWG